MLIGKQLRCYKYRIYQRTKAIHNDKLRSVVDKIGATNIGYIKERKQFTTVTLVVVVIRVVLQI